MTSVLRALQTEWNSLVPAARSRGIPRVRALNVDDRGVPTALETIAYRRTKLEWLKAQLGSSASFETLTFGVELECIAPRTHSREHIARLIQEAGVACNAEMYNHTTRVGHWKVVTDGSVLSSAGHGVELVSPPLRGEDGFAQLRKVCEVLTRIGCKVNKTCGLHVHVGAANQHLGFFKNLVRLYASAQDTIDTFLSPSRRGWSNVYCRPVQVNETALEAATTVAEVARAAGQGTSRDGTRYRKLNLQSFWQHGTVEFRHHQGTVEAHKAENWTRLCLRMAVAATEPKTARSFGELMEVVKAADGERSYFEGRAAHFRTHL